MMTLTKGNKNIKISANKNFVKLEQDDLEDILLLNKLDNNIYFIKILLGANGRTCTVLIT